MHPVKPLIEQFKKIAAEKASYDHMPVKVSQQLDEAALPVLKNLVNFLTGYNEEQCTGMDAEDIMFNMFTVRGDVLDLISDAGIRGTLDVRGDNLWMHFYDHYHKVSISYLIAPVSGRAMGLFQESEPQVVRGLH